MLTLSKKSIVALIIILTTSLLLIEPTTAPVTIPVNPRAGPDVSVEIHNNPLWHPPMDHTDPYTGEVLYTTPEGYSQSGSINII